MDSTWTHFLRGILKMPGATINRDQFLRKTFAKLPEEQLQQVLQSGPCAVASPQEIDKLATAIINRHTRQATALSALAGIPGGVGLLASIPADIANYYYHIVSVGQKLGYLYGYPAMLDDREELTDEGRIMLTAFIGIMNKVTAAQQLIKTVAQEAAMHISQETATRVAAKLLRKQIIGQLVELVAKKLGTRITAQTGGRALTKAIPLVSGVICGAITYRTFRLAALRLCKALAENSPCGQKVTFCHIAMSDINS